MNKVQRIKKECELKEIQLLFDGGLLTKATITNGLEENWIIVFESKQGAHKQFVSLYTQRDEQRTFSTIDAACRLLKRVGFRDIAVQMR